MLGPAPDSGGKHRPGAPANPYRACNNWLTIASVREYVRRIQNGPASAKSSSLGATANGEEDSRQARESAQRHELGAIDERGGA